MEVDLESEDPTEVGDDMISSEDEGGQEVTTLVERREPVAASTDGGLEAERCGDVPMPRKHDVSSYAVGEREAKRMWSPHPSEASPALSLPASGMMR